MDVSVILVSYNTKDLTRNCLNSIYEKTKDIEFEVYVVDNNSHDGSPEMVEQEFPQVRLIKNPDNKGFGAANNIAIRESNAKYIFCLNTDTLLLDNSIKQFFDFMEKEENQKIGACGGQLYYEDMTPAACAGHRPNLCGILFRLFKLQNILKPIYNRFFSLGITSDKNAVLPYYVDYIVGADLFIRNSILKDLNGFDETFFMYYEETDLCKRIQTQGEKCIILPQVSIIHKEAKSFKGNNERKILLMKKSECIYLYKHFGMFIHFLMYIYCCIKYKDDFLKLYVK